MATEPLPAPTSQIEVAGAGAEAGEDEGAGLGLGDHARPVLELLLGERPPAEDSRCRRRSNPCARHPRLVQHEHHVRVLPAPFRATSPRRPRNTRSSGPPSLSATTKVRLQTFQLPGELGGSEARGGEDRDLRVGAADVDGAAGIAAVGADGERRRPRRARRGRRPGRRRRRPGRTRRFSAPEPLSEQAHDAEEAGVPRGEHDDRTVRRLLSARARPRDRP